MLNSGIVIEYSLNSLFGIVGLLSSYNSLLNSLSGHL